MFCIEPAHPVQVYTNEHMTSSLHVLRNRDFRILFMTRLLGTMALQAQAIIVGWQVYSLTRSPFMLGLAGLVEAIPALGCALVAGYVVDISRPYRVFLACITALALNMTFLFVTGGGVIALPNDTLIACIFTGVFFSGLARSFVIPSSFALQPQVVPREHIPAAGAWLANGFQIGVICGPAIAGIIYGAYGARSAWMMPMALMCAEFVFALGIGHAHRNFHSGQKREPIATSLREGWAFILSKKLLLCIMALDMFAVLFGGAIAILPAYADRVLHVGSEGLGALRAAPALGAVAMTLWFALRPMKEVKGSVLLWAVGGFGMCIIALGLSKAFWLSMLCLALSGALDSISMVIRYTLVQWLTPAHMRGRISAVNSMFIISSNEIGAFESGTAAQLLGLVPSILFGGLGTLVVVLAAALIFPAIRTTKVTAET